MRILAAAALAVLIIPGGGQAQQACASRETIVERLAAGYGETRAGLGIAGNQIVELFVSAETGTWTIVVTRPGGPTCLAASGQNWEATDEAPPMPGEEG